MTLLLSIACIYKTPPDTLVDQGNALPKELGTVLVAPVQVMASHSESPFVDGVFVGNLVHSGGYVQEEVGDYGIQTHSKLIETGAQAPYTELALDFTQQAIGAALDARGATWTPLPELVVEMPETKRVRGSHPLDGTDNVNLPRFELTPPPMPAVSAQGDHLLVPFVVSYYSHNAGWFYGQHMGCQAGARGRVYWVLYDLGQQRPVAWADLQSRFLYTNTFQANSAETEDALIAVEQQLQDALVKSFK
ncbi:MAG: hypothetical protein VX899_21300 [Myxococcota bacterium]|nr:hypothetical protein [Myxococcota bacterium]